MWCTLFDLCLNATWSWLIYLILGATPSFAVCRYRLTDSHENVSYVNKAKFLGSQQSNMILRERLRTEQMSFVVECYAVWRTAIAMALIVILKDILMSSKLHQQFFCCCFYKLLSPTSIYSLRFFLILCWFRTQQNPRILLVIRTICVINYVHWNSTTAPTYALRMYLWQLQFSPAINTIWIGIGEWIEYWYWTIKLIIPNDSIGLAVADRHLCAPVRHTREIAHQRF